jgi:hypothetical protein
LEPLYSVSISPNRSLDLMFQCSRCCFFLRGPIDTFVRLGIWGASICSIQIHPESRFLHIDCLRRPLFTPRLRCFVLRALWAKRTLCRMHSSGLRIHSWSFGISLPFSRSLCWRIEIHRLNSDKMQHMVNRHITAIW